MKGIIRNIQMSKMIRNSFVKDAKKSAQVGALGTKIYVCGGTDDSWTAHATVEVGLSTTVMMTSRVVMTMMIIRKMDCDDQ